MAAGSPATDVLVVLSLRGGMDGLSLVVPHGDPALSRWRPSIAVPGAVSRPVDAMFGLHPALAPLYPLWDAGTLGAVHACGMVAANRSHFSAMEEMEEAAPDSSLRTGWIDRMVGVTGAASPFTATGLGLSAVPTALRGTTPELVVPSLAGVGVTVDSRRPAVARGRRACAGCTTASAPRCPAPRTWGCGRRSRCRACPPRAPTRPGGSARSCPTWPGWSRRTSACAWRPSTSAAGTCTPGLGSAEPGRWMYDMVAEMAAALAAFAADLGPGAGPGVPGHAVGVRPPGAAERLRRRRPRLRQRRPRHGRRRPRREGPRALARAWPRRALVGGDLAVTTDYRDVLAELLSVRCGVPSAEVFPGLRPAPLGLARPLA